jgi:hypothetical protein
MTCLVWGYNWKLCPGSCSCEDKLEEQRVLEEELKTYTKESSWCRLEELEDATIQETDEIDDLLVVSMHILATKTVEGLLIRWQWRIGWLIGWGTKKIAICLR